MVAFSPDADILNLPGFPDAPQLGSGGEARVHALDADRVVRLSHGPAVAGCVLVIRGGRCGGNGLVPEDPADLDG